jgi:hypothetical protein
LNASSYLSLSACPYTCPPYYSSAAHGREEAGQWGVRPADPLARYALEAQALT